MHITIVDDEKMLSWLIQKKLEKLEYHVTVFNSYKAFCDKDTAEADLYLVDISLWDGHGFDIISKIRSQTLTKNIPILLMSGYDSISLKVEGLNIGADDYIVKPFDSEELLARIRSLTRRSHSHIILWDLHYWEFSFDITQRELRHKSKVIHLLKKEKQVLEIFFRSPWKLISKEEIARKIWWQKPTKIIENTITVTICTLRKKLGSNFKLVTKVSEGYILQ